MINCSKAREWTSICIGPMLFSKYNACEARGYKDIEFQQLHACACHVLAWMTEASKKSRCFCHGFEWSLSCSYPPVLRWWRNDSTTLARKRPKKERDYQVKGIVESIFKGQSNDGLNRPMNRKKAGKPQKAQKSQKNQALMSTKRIAKLVIIFCFNYLFLFCAFCLHPVLMSAYPRIHNMTLWPTTVFRMKQSF